MIGDEVRCLLSAVPYRITAARELCDGGAFEKAESALRAIVRELCEEHLPDSVPVERLRFAARRDLAEVLLAKADYGASEELLLTAGEHVARTLGAGSMEAAVCANDLGVLYKHLGRFREAREMYTRAGLILEWTAPGGHEMATLLHNLGGLAHGMGRPSEGEHHARRAVELRTALHGASHVHVAADLANLGALLEAQGKLNEAQACFHRAVEVFERAYGRAHHEVAVNLANLAAVAERRGDWVTSEGLYREALELQLQLAGTAHPQTMRTLGNLAHLYLVVGRREEAVAAYRRVVATLEPLVPADHPVLRSARRHLLESDLP
ncbi:tetratricopeptide repeat protein [Streptosporangium sp. OZ121]|uniref:tetratricopeptide repeat protein n=1 Tax=Streptosporangium sp. OZ121 TaxID=3444183 RepID=UPI003F79D132